MPEPRVFHRHGPFLWQAKLRSAHFDRVWEAQMVELRKAEARLAATRAASAAWIAEREAEKASAAVHAESETRFSPEMEAAADALLACAGVPCPRAATSAGNKPERAHPAACFPDTPVPSGGTAQASAPGPLDSGGCV